MRKKGAELFRAQLATWMIKLKKEYATSLIKPQGGAAKKDPTKASTPAPVKVAAKKAASSGSGADNKAPAPKKEKPQFVTITAEDEFKCKAADLFAAICTEEKVRAYTQSECKIDPKIGGEFSLFSGNVTGVFQELEPHKLIKQAWRFKHWPAGHFSEVTLTITELDDKCKLELRQTNVPEADRESTKNGWRTHQWERMKAILGFGSGLSFGF